MNTFPRLLGTTVSLTAIGATLFVLSTSAQAQPTFQSVSNGLVSFYPLDYVLTNGVTRTTPDHIGGRDLILSPATDADNVVPANRPLGAPGASSNCFNLNQSGGPTVLYYTTRGQNPLDITNLAVSDFLPFCNQLNATMSFWIKSAASGTDTRFFGEAANDGNNDPLWLWGDQSSSPGAAHLLFRSNGGNPWVLSDGTRQSPVPGTYSGSVGPSTTNVVMDNTWHLFTVVIDAKGFVDVYVDANRDPGNNMGVLNYTNALGQPAVSRPMFVTNTYYTTNVYPKVSPPVVNPGPNGYVKHVFNSIFTGGSTAFGGFKRGGISGGKVMQIDDIAFWNRALTAEEIAFVHTNGLPGISITRPPGINSFAASVAEVGKGDVATLSWNVVGAVPNPGSITISGVGDVTSIGPIGSVDVPMTGGDQMFTLTIASESGVASKSITVKVLPGVDSNWHLFQRFDGLFTDTVNWIGPDIFGNRDWHATCCSFAGFFDSWKVITLSSAGGTNKVLSPEAGYRWADASPIGFDTPGANVYGNLNSLTVGPNQNRTLFFRFSLRDPQSWVQSHGLHSDMDASIGLTDFNFWDGPGQPAPDQLLNKGPFVNIVRVTRDGTFTHSEPFDLRAYDFNGMGTTSNYSYRASVSAAGLQTNVNYMLWMNIENRNTGYDTNTASTTNMPLYSVYLQKQGDANRTLLFSNFRGNRDFAPPQALGPNKATPFLDKFFAVMGAHSILTNGAGAYYNTNVAGAYFETNMIAIDDIYISKNGFESSIPKLLDLSSIVRNPASVTLNWNSLCSLFQTNTYTILRNTQPTGGTWTPLATAPSGGDTTTFTDNSPPAADTVYYRISWP